MSQIALLFSAQNTVPEQTYPIQSKQDSEKSFRKSLITALTLNDRSDVKDVNSESDLSKLGPADNVPAHTVNSEEIKKDIAENAHYGLSLTGLPPSAQVAAMNSSEPEELNGLGPDAGVDSNKDALDPAETIPGKNPIGQPIGHRRGYMIGDRDTGMSKGKDKGTDTDARNGDSYPVTSSIAVTSLNTSHIPHEALGDSHAAETVRHTGNSDQNRNSGASMSAPLTVPHEKLRYANHYIVNNDSQLHKGLDEYDNLSSNNALEVNAGLTGKYAAAHVSTIPNGGAGRMFADIPGDPKSPIVTNTFSGSSFDLAATQVPVSDPLSDIPTVLHSRNGDANEFGSTLLSSLHGKSESISVSASEISKDTGYGNSTTGGFKDSAGGENIAGQYIAGQNTSGDNSDGENSYSRHTSGGDTDGGDSLRTQDGGHSTSISQSVSSRVHKELSRVGDTRVNEGFVSNWEKVPDELYLTSGSSLTAYTYGQTDNTGFTSSITESAVTEFSNRVETVVKMQEAARHRSISEMTIKLENYNSKSDSIRISLRGSHLETTIAVSESVRAKEILSRLPELQRSLDRQGFDNHEVSVISEEESNRERGSTFRDHRKQSNQDKQR